MTDTSLFAKNMRTIVYNILLHSGMASSRSTVAEMLADRSVLEIEVTPEDIDILVTDEKHSEFPDALCALDISELDIPRIFQILDADRSGTLSVLEFIHGVTRLRGLSSRADIVA